MYQHRDQHVQAARVAEQVQKSEEEKTEDQSQEVLLAQETTQGVSIMVEEQDEKIRFLSRCQTML